MKIRNFDQTRQFSPAHLTWFLMSVLVRPEGDDIAASYGEDYLQYEGLVEMDVGQKYEVLCADGMHYQAEVKAFDSARREGVFHFCHWSVAYDYKGSFEVLYIAPDGLYSRGLLSAQNQYKTEDKDKAKSRRPASHRAISKEFLESTRYPDDYLSKPRLFPGRQRRSLAHILDEPADDGNSESGDSATKRRKGPASVNLPQHALLAAFMGVGASPSPPANDELPVPVASSSSPWPKAARKDNAMLKMENASPAHVMFSSTMSSSSVNKPATPVARHPLSPTPAPASSSSKPSSSLSKPIITLPAASAAPSPVPQPQPRQPPPPLPAPVLEHLRSLSLEDSIAQTKRLLIAMSGSPSTAGTAGVSKEDKLLTAANTLRLLEARMTLDELLLTVLKQQP